MLLFRARNNKPRDVFIIVRGRGVLFSAVRKPSLRISSLKLGSTYYISLSEGTTWNMYTAWREANYLFVKFVFIVTTTYENV